MRPTFIMKHAGQNRKRSWLTLALELWKRPILSINDHKYSEIIQTVLHIWWIHLSLVLYFFDRTLWQFWHCKLLAVVALPCHHAHANLRSLYRMINHNYTILQSWPKRVGQLPKLYPPSPYSMLSFIRHRMAAHLYDSTISNSWNIRDQRGEEGGTERTKRRLRHSK